MTIQFRCRGKVMGVYSKDTAPRSDLIGKPRRAGCGAVLNPLIDLIDTDGSEHTVECPECGSVCRILKTPEG